MPRNLAGAIARRLDPADVGILREIGSVAARLGAEAYLVGGAVRDLLAAFPVHDLDVVVDGEPSRILAKLRSGVVVARAHERFQTASIALPSGARLDLSAARREVYARPAALPVISRAPLEDDLLRRDFTINAMAIRIEPGRFGVVVDPFSGREDLDARRIRILHPRSFLDDPTRAFRAVRFAVRLDFSIERSTARRMGESIAKGVVDLLSSQRLRREIEQLLGARRTLKTVRLLDRFGLLRTLHGGIEPTPRTYRALRRCDRDLAWFRARFPDEELAAWTIPLAILASTLHDAEREALVDRLAPDRTARRILLESEEGLRELDRRLGGRRPPAASRIHRACRVHRAEVLLLASSRLADLTASVRLYLGALRAIRSDVRGADLIREGLEPGPGIARGLDAALAAKLDGRAVSRRDQLAIALKEGRKGSSLGRSEGVKT